MEEGWIGVEDGQLTRGVYVACADTYLQLP